jgi:hypothetical protein
MKKQILLVLICLCLSVPVVAMAAPDVSVTPEGRVYANFHYDITSYPDWDARYANHDHNEFEVMRAYLGLSAKIGEHWGARVLGDVYRPIEWTPKFETDDEGNPVEDANGNKNVVDMTSKKGRYTFMLKYAYGEYLPFKALGLRLGMIPTAYTDMYDGAGGWGYRFIAASPADRATFESSADLGFAIFGDFPKGFGSYYVTARNGEGYTNIELNSGKAVQARVAVNPFAALDMGKDVRLVLAYRYNVVTPDTGPTAGRTWSDLADVLVQVPLDFGKGWGLNFGGGWDWMETKTADNDFADTVLDGQVIHGYLVINFPYHIGLFSRVDMLGPNTKNEKGDATTPTEGYQDETTWAVAGISFSPVKYVNLALDWQTTIFTAEVEDDKGDKVLKTAEQLVYVNTEFKF